MGNWNRSVTSLAMFNEVYKNYTIWLIFLNKWLYKRGQFHAPPAFWPLSLCHSEKNWLNTWKKYVWYLASGQVLHSYSANNFHFGASLMKGTWHWIKRLNSLDLNMVGNIQIQMNKVYKTVLVVFFIDILKQNLTY